MVLTRRIGLQAKGGLGTMTDFFSTLGTIVAAFFILSLAVETILDNFRGILALVGITVLKSKVTMDDALAEAAEFVRPDSIEYARFAGLAALVKAQKAAADETRARCTGIIEALAGAISPADKDALIARERLWLAEMAAPMRAAMERNEEKRVFVLRIISAIIGVVVAWYADINILQITGTPTSPGTTEVAFIGYVLCGLAAAGGSSFWHDQLDRIRNVKQIGQELVSINTGPVKA